jgi:hypothetical protein
MTDNPQLVADVLFHGSKAEPRLSASEFAPAQDPLSRGSA